MASGELGKLCQTHNRRYYTKAYEKPEPPNLGPQSPKLNTMKLLTS